MTKMYTIFKWWKKQTILYNTGLLSVTTAPRYILQSHLQSSSNTFTTNSLNLIWNIPFNRERSCENFTYGKLSLAILYEKLSPNEKVTRKKLGRKFFKMLRLYNIKWEVHECPLYYSLYFSHCLTYVWLATMRDWLGQRVRDSGCRQLLDCAWI